MSVLLDVLSYNTHYNAFYTNMLANEMFLDTAQQRDSVVSRAKELGISHVLQEVQVQMSQSLLQVYQTQYQNLHYQRIQHLQQV